MGGFLNYKRTLPSHVQFFIHQYPPSPSPQGCSQSTRLPACTDIGDCHDAGAGPCNLASLNFMRFTWAHTSRLSRYFRLAIPSLFESTALLSMMSPANLLRVHSNPPHVIDEDIEHYGTPKGHHLLLISIWTLSS
ncbi:hypothetical protein llap_16794 [Limosa lapponica baueri]|uniref:Uncharacterized protein n=1 Tax=Limosa lapponica baueri TaxID=1758121 RepID=A0A2I0TGN4_LIMLA|nr:hypothetical protein llap_16794 [Limosa lapponica baueri]